MKSKVMRAIRLSKLEGDLVDLNREIKRFEGMLNSEKVGYRYKKDIKKELERMIVKKKNLTDQITESMLLED